MFSDGREMRDERRKRGWRGALRFQHRRWMRKNCARAFANVWGEEKKSHKKMVIFRDAGFTHIDAVHRNLGSVAVQLRRSARAEHPAHGIHLGQKRGGGIVVWNSQRRKAQVTLGSGQQVDFFFVFFFRVSFVDGMFLLFFWGWACCEESVFETRATPAPMATALHTGYSF